MHVTGNTRLAVNRRALVRVIDNHYDDQHPEKDDFWEV
jgi:hypothetical protein